MLELHKGHCFTQLQRVVITRITKREIALIGATCQCGLTWWPCLDLGSDGSIWAMRVLALTCLTSAAMPAVFIGGSLLFYLHIE